MAIDVTAIGVGVDTSKLRQGTKDLDTFGRSANRAAGQADQSTKAMSGMTAIAGKLAIVLGAAGLSRSLITAIDANTKYTAQLKLATQSQTQFNTALADVQRIARTAQSDIGSVATLYARLNNALRDVGVTQAEVARITENVGLALKVSGATASESSSAILQLSQAFASGVLRGEEFNAVSESAPALMRALAESIGVPIGALREMAAEGKITGEVLNKAFGDEKLLAKFREQAKEVQTIAGAFTQLKNSLMILAGEVATTTGVGVSFADILSTIARNIESVANVIKGDLKGAFDSILPAYREFKKLQDKEASKALPAATTSSGSILPQGSRMGQPLRRDLGLVSEVTETAAAFNGLKKQLDGFRTNNPLKDLTTANQEYAQGLAIVRANVLAMNMTQAEGQRYEAQLKADWEKATKGSKEYGQAEKSRRDEALKDIQNEIDFEMDIKETRDKAELKAIEDAKELQLKADKEVAEAREKYMDVQQKRADDNFKEAQEVYKKQVSEYEKIFDRANDNLARSLTDSIIRGFDNGKKFIQNFKDAISNAFKGYFVNIGVNFVQNAISGVMGDVGKSVASAFGFGNGAAPAGGGFGGVLKDLGNIFTSSNQSIFSGIESLGASISNGMGGIRDTIGGYLGANASFVANAASYAGAVLQLAQGNWAGAAGTAIGTALGGPLGGAIGSFLGGAVGSLFGGKVKTSKFSTGAKTSYADGKLTSSQGLSGLEGYGKSLGGSDGLVQLGEQYSKLMGSLFKAFDMSDAVSTRSRMFQRSSSKTRSWAYFDASFESGGGFKANPTGGRQDANQTMKELVEWVLGKGVVKGVQSSTLPDAIKDLFNGITTEAEAMNMINATITLGNANQALIDSFNLTAIQAAKVAMVSGQTGDELAKVVAILAAAGNESRKIGDALFEFRNMLKDAMGGTIYNSLKEFDNALKGIDKSTQAGIEAFYELFSLRGDFAKFQASIDGLRGGVKGALFSIVSDAEKQQMLNNDLATMFAELKMTVPGSIQELIALGKSIDYTTAEGLNLASVFPALVNAFNTTRGAVDSLINSLTSSRFETFADFAIGSSLARQGVPINQIPVRGASQGSDNQVAILLTRLIAEVSEMKASTQQTADNTLRTTRELEDIAGGNVTLSTQAA